MLGNQLLTPLSIRLTEKQSDRLDYIARTKGMSRNEATRWVLDLGLDEYAAKHLRPPLNKKLKRVAEVIWDRAFD